MASYYNKTRSPITVSLKNGRPALIPPKSKLVVEPRQDGSPSLHAMVRRGYLVRLRAPSVPSQTAIAAPSEEDKRRVEAGGDAEEVPSMDWTKDELIDHADNLGLEIASSWTKREILDEIKGAK